MNKIIVLLFACISMSYGQQNTFSLEEAIAIAQNNAIDNQRTKTNLSLAKFDVAINQSQLRPQVTADGTLPNFLNTTASITQPNGSILFQDISQNSSNVGVTISQEILPTNTRIFAQSSLFRFDDFSADFTNYNSIPIRIGAIQQLNNVNSLQWDKTINQKQLEIAELAHNEQQLNNRVQLTQAYFSVLTAQTDITIAQSNFLNNEEIYRIAQERYTLGTLSKADLLQIEFNKNNSKRASLQAHRNLERQLFVLQAEMNYFSLQKTMQFDIPDQLPLDLINPSQVAELAIANNTTIKQAELNQLLNKRSVEQAKREFGFRASIQASIGLVKSGPSLTEAYQNPQNETFINIGFSIPIFDGKHRKNQVQKAQESLRLTEMENTFTQETLWHNVFQLAQQVNMLYEEVNVSKQNFEIAQQRYDIANKRFALGNISITDLGIAFNERDVALRTYIFTLQEFWTNYYTVKQLTINQ